MTFQEVLFLRGVRCRNSAGDRAKIHLNCPFCVERGKPSDTRMRLCVHLTQGWGRCVHCDWRRRYAIPAVLRQLGIRDTVVGGVPLPEAEVEEVCWPEDYRRLSPKGDELDLLAYQYVHRRGVTDEQIRENRIGVSYLGRYAYRVIFPVLVKGELKGINARAFLSNREPKYLNSRGDKYLFHFNSEAETVIFSEGVFKALRIAREFPDSTALLGHDLALRQEEQIAESRCRRAILYPDLDLPGRQGALKIAEKLQSLSIDVQLVMDAQQPADEVPLEEIPGLIAGAQDFGWAMARKLLL